MGELGFELSSRQLRGGRREKWISHYCSSHNILLVGEGDFSFSACLAKAFGSGDKMVATSVDSKAELPVKHWSSVQHLEELKELGCTVLHDVDVADMHEHAFLRRFKFDRIIYNFPHSGHDPCYCERNGELIRRHKELMKAFFESASKMIVEDGEIHVSHRNDYPYSRWKLDKLAKKAGLVLIEMAEFCKSDYPGYHNKRGGGIRSNQTFPLKHCFTFKFSLLKSLEAEEGETQRDNVVESLDLTFLTLCLENQKGKRTNGNMRGGKGENQKGKRTNGNMRGGKGGERWVKINGGKESEENL